ncbi:hypothetical protein DFH07DRAFT_770859 [Mycena maculata]|uniref:Uncharacterized protein n=1 Tax=Mycena maculata TaxID=230809 RepID=A0AAD7JG92_9AGAR|nr:hypothetical protein DFH07DRAFT_770859 [Mycena maculata]
MARPPSSIPPTPNAMRRNSGLFDTARAPPPFLIDTGTTILIPPPVPSQRAAEPAHRRTPSTLRPAPRAPLFPPIFGQNIDDPEELDSATAAGRATGFRSSAKARGVRGMGDANFGRGVRGIVIEKENIDKGQKKTRGGSVTTPASAGRQFRDPTENISRTLRRSAPISLSEPEKSAGRYGIYYFTTVYLCDSILSIEMTGISRGEPIWLGIIKSNRKIDEPEEDEETKMKVDTRGRGRRETVRRLLGSQVEHSYGGCRGCTIKVTFWMVDIEVDDFERLTTASRNPEFQWDEETKLKDGKGRRETAIRVAKPCPDIIKVLSVDGWLKFGLGDATLLDGPTTAFRKMKMGPRANRYWGDIAIARRQDGHHSSYPESRGKFMRSLLNRPTPRILGETIKTNSGYECDALQGGWRAIWARRVQTCRDETVSSAGGWSWS